MAKKRRLQNKLEKLQDERQHLVLKQNQLERGIREVKNADNKTEETYERKEELKDQFNEVQERISVVNKEIDNIESQLRSYEIEDEEDLQIRFEEMSEELTDTKLALENAKEKRDELRGVKRAAEELLKTLSRSGLLQVARMEDEDKNIYSSTGASLWTGDLWSVEEKAEELRDLL